MLILDQKRYPHEVSRRSARLPMCPCLKIWSVSVVLERSTHSSRTYIEDETFQERSGIGVRANVRNQTDTLAAAHHVRVSQHKPAGRHRHPYDSS